MNEEKGCGFLAQEHSIQAIFYGYEPKGVFFRIIHFREDSQCHEETEQDPWEWGQRQDTAPDIAQVQFNRDTAVQNRGGVLVWDWGGGVVRLGDRVLVLDPEELQ